MHGPRLLDALPELERDGLVSPEQAERIRARYAAAPGTGGNRLMLLFSVLGGLLIGLGIILVVANNWDDLGRPARTALAFLPMAVGQGLVLFTVLKRAAHRGWCEGSAVFLLLAVGACIAMMSQIYHTGGTLEEFLLLWSVLTVGLLYVPGSLLAGMLYLGMITWYAGLVRMENWSSTALPWLYWPLLAAAFPLIVREGKARGKTIGFHWLMLVLASSIGVASQLFWRNDHFEIALGIAGLAAAYLLVPALHRGTALRTKAFPVIGGMAMLGVLIFLSYHDVWAHELRRGRVLSEDLWPALAMVALGLAALAWNLRARKSFLDDLMPLSLLVVLLAYGAGWASPVLATVLINAWMLLLGILTLRSAFDEASFRRMNLGLAIISLVVGLRFFDLDISVAIKGAVFIALGVAFLVMNLRLVRLRNKQPHA